MTSTVRSGRSRLAICLCLFFGGLCFALMATLLIVYGPPWDGIWWLVMAIILFAACSLPYLLVYPIEWVIDGYRQQD